MIGLLCSTDLHSCFWLPREAFREAVDVTNVTNATNVTNVTNVTNDQRAVPQRPPLDLRTTASTALTAQHPR